MAAQPTVDLVTAADRGVPQAAAPVSASVSAPVSTKLRFLMAADDSGPSIHAVETFIAQLAWYRDPVELHLLSTQAAVHGDVSAFVDNAELTNYHHAEGLKALGPARERLDRAGVAYIMHIGVGNPAQVIAHYGREKQCHQIFMSEHAGAAASGLLGSVAIEVVRLSDVPVALV